MAFSPRNAVAYVTIVIFLLYFLSSGIDNSFKSDVKGFFTSSGLPDFSRYNNELRALSSDEFPIDDPNKRVFIVGDIHGSEKSMHKLLDKLSYNPRKDVFIHVGDIIAKGPHKGSLAVLSYMAKHNITGVRGNHDQKVIEWRGWMDWIKSLPGGKTWLEALDTRSAHIAEEEEGEELAEQELGTMSRHWKKRIPKGWKLFSDHYRIARDMSKKEYEYLVSLPLVLHIPTAHTFIVHAGLLPSDPSRDPSHHRQPLSHMPILPSSSNSHSEGQLRLAQELALLTQIPQNTDPWNKLNIRSVTKSNKVTKSSKDGTPWSELWNDAMGQCVGYGNDVKGKKGKLACKPSMVVYGHAASRGLDVKRWSIGTDSGCVYGRRLSALVLGSGSAQSASPSINEIEEADQAFQGIQFGDGHRGRIVSVSCR